MENSKSTYLYIILAVVILAGLWIWLDRMNTTQNTASPSTSPSISPVPEQSGSNVQLQQELDASVPGNVDGEFKDMDKDASGL